MAIAAVIGLGNPGDEYAATRHNVGFAVVDELARRLRLSSWQHRHSALLARRAGARPLLLVKPQTYMNLSGDAVALVCRREDIRPSGCLVVVDDVDLPLGQLRLRERGGPGTHNGLRSIVQAIGEGFPRLRVGVRGERSWRDLADYVLEPFADDEREAAAASIERAAECIQAALHEGLSRAATRFNRVPASGSDESAGDKPDEPKADR